MTTEVKTQDQTQDTPNEARVKAQAEACMTVIHNTTKILEAIAENSTAFTTIGFPHDHVVFEMLNEASAIAFDLGQAMLRSISTAVAKAEAMSASPHVDQSNVN